MRIAIDAMGGDNAPLEIIKGSLAAAKENEFTPVLVGRIEDMQKAFAELGHSGTPEGVELVDAREVITMEDDPTVAVRKKKDSSMSVALRMLHEDKVDAVVSAGSTGALLVGASLVVKRIPGIRRAALAPFLPSKSGKCLLVDCGANTECTPEYLLQFGIMGSMYCRYALGIEKPRVGLLSNGTEETKGGTLQKETFVLLKQARDEGKINFIGNVEGRDVCMGGCDVAVCDGFTGNVMMKGMEGIGLYMLSSLKKAFYKNWRNKLAALILKKDITALKKQFDVSEIGGTVLLGVRKPVVKAHGSSDAKAFTSSIRQVCEIVNTDVCGGIAKEIRAAAAQE